MSYDELRARLDAQDGTLLAILTAIEGNSLGTLGLVKEVEELKKAREEYKLDKVKIYAGLGVLMFLGGLLATAGGWAIELFRKHGG